MSQQKQVADEGSGNDHPNSVSGNEGGFMGGEGRFNSVNSYYHGEQWVPWNVFDQVCSFGLEVSDFLSQYACCDFLSQYAYCDVQYECNMHIAMQYRFFSSKSEGFRVYVHIALKNLQYRITQPYCHAAM